MDTALKNKQEEEHRQKRKTQLPQTIELSITQFKPETSFSIMSLNARSVNNKFQDIREVVHKLRLAVLCTQETWGENAGTD